MKTRPLMNRHLAFLLALCVAVTAAVPLTALSGARPVQYLPGVTEEMADPAFWSGLTSDPDALLATPEEIIRINEAAEAVEGSNRRDLKKLPETYNGIARNEALQESAADDAKYYLGWIWDETGKKMEQEDFDLLIANCIDPGAKEEMPVRWGIAVNRTDLVTFPWDGMLLDDPGDLDFDYQPLVGIRVNEPVAVYATSADGKYFQAVTSCCSGWVRAEDIAICADREEWLSAWDIPAEKRLVFWGDRMYTDFSRSAPETVCRMITMGTVLERMEDTDPDALVINRLPLHNYAVYLPVRHEDGSYGKTPALINARERVSEDFLPLTPRNLSKVALAALGNAYGWGAGLYNEDCTSLNHSIFRCFGLDIPRNGTWQWLLDYPKADIANYTLEEKEALFDALPLGTLLNFPGHQMMYLGKTAGNYYVVSAVSSIMSPWSGARGRTRDVQINTLDIRRANGKTWIGAMNKITIPWLYLNEGETYAFPELPAYHEDTAFCLEHGLIDPYATGYFLPERGATVAEAVRMLWRIAGTPEPEEGAEGYADVAAGSADEKAALWAKQTGVYTGADGKFRGTAPLTGEALRDMTRKLLNEDIAVDLPAKDARVLRHELAKAGRWAFDVWEEQHPSLTAPVEEDEDFGSVYIMITTDEFSARGFAFGDSCDLVFSNGFTLEDVPYYIGYYTRSGLPLIVGYPGTPYIAVCYNSGESMWKKSGCKAGDTVTVTCREKGKYLSVQESMAMTYEDDRALYDSDEMFANYRVMKGGALAENSFYRGASPVDNRHNRAAFANALIERDGIRFILDLADTEAKIRGYMDKDDFRSDYAAGLLAEGKIAALGLDNAYGNDYFKKALAGGLRAMTGQEGPCYIHCTEGKDRTGFVCLLLEALCGANYGEIRDDYMASFANYYRLTPDSDRQKYDMVVHLDLDDMLLFLPGVEGESFTEDMTFTENAKAYLLDAGMTGPEIDSLIRYLTKAED